MGPSKPDRDEAQENLGTVEQTHHENAGKYEKRERQRIRCAGPVKRNTGGRKTGRKHDKQEEGSLNANARSLNDVVKMPVIRPERRNASCRPSDDCPAQLENWQRDDPEHRDRPYSRPGKL